MSIKRDCGPAGAHQVRVDCTRSLTSCVCPGARMTDHRQRRGQFVVVGLFDVGLVDSGYSVRCRAVLAGRNLVDRARRQTVGLDRFRSRPSTNPVGYQPLNAIGDLGRNRERSDLLADPRQQSELQAHVQHLAANRGCGYCRRGNHQVAPHRAERMPARPIAIRPPSKKRNPEHSQDCRKVHDVDDPVGELNRAKHFPGRGSGKGAEGAGNIKTGSVQTIGRESSSGATIANEAATAKNGTVGLRLGGHLPGVGRSVQGSQGRPGAAPSN
jgi:hypothetical protein